MKNFKMKAGTEIKKTQKIYLFNLKLQLLCSGKVIKACGLGGLFKLHSKEL